MHGDPSLPAGHFAVAMTVAVLLGATVPEGIGVVEVWVTDVDDHGTAHPLPGVELELTCNRPIRFPSIRTDAAGKATIKAALSSCTLKATSHAAAGARSYLWSSHVEFSRTPSRLDLSTAESIVLPVLVHSVEPVYPEDLRAEGIGGDVVLETVVRRDGSVGKVRVVRSTNRKLEKPAVVALKQRTYEPALEHGSPIELWIATTIEFGGEPQPRVLEEGVVVPVLLESVDPVYPPAARSGRIEGWVVVQAVINKDGDVSGARVRTSTNRVFDEAALKAVRKRKYEPASRDGKPVAIHLSIRIDFRLR